MRPSVARKEPAKATPKPRVKRIMAKIVKALADKKYGPRLGRN